MMFLYCPAYLDQDGAQQCGLPAEVRCRFTMGSADGPLESAMIRCPVGHHFSGPIGSLTLDRTDKPEPDTAGTGSRAGRVSLRSSHDVGGGSDPGAAERKARRPNSAPAYYLGHPARLWITAMGSHRRASDPMQAASGERPTPSRHRDPVTDLRDFAVL